MRAACVPGRMASPLLCQTSCLRCALAACCCLLLQVPWHAVLGNHGERQGLLLQPCSSYVFDAGRPCAPAPLHPCVCISRYLPLLHILV